MSKISIDFEQFARQYENHFDELPKYVESYFVATLEELGARIVYITERFWFEEKEDYLDVIRISKPSDFWETSSMERVEILKIFLSKEESVEFATKESKIRNLTLISE